jgi:hypothetical protein
MELRPPRNPDQAILELINSFGKDRRYEVLSANEIPLDPVELEGVEVVIRIRKLRREYIACLNEFAVLEDDEVQVLVAQAHVYDSEWNQLETGVVSLQDEKLRFRKDTTFSELQESFDFNDKVLKGGSIIVGAAISGVVMWLVKERINRD